MRKKASRNIHLVLITSVLASCSQQALQQSPDQQRVYMRADSTAVYTEVTDQYNQQRQGGGGMGSAFLWFMAFRHLGGGLGYANSGLHPSSVAGANANKAAAMKAQRGGFGKTSTVSPTSSVGA